MIVVDNGSATPPTAGEFESLGIDLRVLHYPHPTHSPVGAVNYGLNQSVGHYVCVYIDGARIASPGLLREAWRKGIVLAGTSAGAICWFDHGVTDSWAGHLMPLECMGFLPGTCCPHYDGEADRRPTVHDFISRDVVPPVLALNDGAAAHFVGRTLHRVVTWRPTAHAYRVSRRRGAVVETELPATRLRAHKPR